MGFELTATCKEKLVVDSRFELLRAEPADSRTKLFDFNGRQIIKSLAF
jgi:hypothetical protein